MLARQPQNGARKEVLHTGMPRGILLVGKEAGHQGDTNFALMVYWATAFRCPPQEQPWVEPSEWPRGRAADRSRYNYLPLAGYIDSPPRGEGKGEACGVRISKGRSPTSGVYLSSMVGPISRKSAGGAALPGVSEELICVWHIPAKSPRWPPTAGHSQA